MKTPEEYLIGCEHDGSYIPVNEVLRIIKQVQKKTWNEALDKAAESAEIKAYYKHRHKGSRYKEWKEGYDVDLFETTQMYKLDKQSILKLKL